jgi:hypothetical protein
MIVGRVSVIAASALLVMSCSAGAGKADAGGTNAAEAAAGNVASPDAVGAMNAAAAVVQEGPAATDASFQSFWPRFRQAALTGDAATLKTLSAPVVLGHGELDDDPVKKLTPAQVPDAVAKLMAAMDPLDGKGHTQRTLVQTKEQFAPGDMDGGKEQRVGNFVFSNAGAKGWQLSGLYLGSE